MMKQLIKTLLPLAVITLIATLSYGQPGLPTAPDQAPIDGGLSLLALGGGAYAAWKLRQKANK